MAITRIDDTTTIPGTTIIKFSGFGSYEYTHVTGYVMLIVVGAGATASPLGLDGENSSITGQGLSIIAAGGKRGLKAGGASGNGNAGGNQAYKSADGWYYGGGGGGAGGIGTAGVCPSSGLRYPGNGGPGVSNSITGSALIYGVGGGGGNCNGNVDLGGDGSADGYGVGERNAPTPRESKDGADGYGNGGGGKALYGHPARRGGHGTVILRYSNDSPTNVTYLCVGAGGGNSNYTGSGGGGGGQVLTGMISAIGKMWVMETHLPSTGDGDLLVSDNRFQYTGDGNLVVKEKLISIIGA